ncbi:cyanocobalamin reductase / alkylcobalamin dealkylase-like [Styela clava]
MDFETVRSTLQRYFGSIGMEIHPFKIDWYNNMVGNPFKLQFDPDAIGFVVISSPSMFEKAFVPYIKNEHDTTNSQVKKRNNQDAYSQRDPLDSCLIHHFNEAKRQIPEADIEIIHDFEILPNKRPKILVQTAAHVAGAAYYYQKADAENKHEKKCPCAVQPHSNGIYEKTSDMPEDENSTDCICESPWNKSKRIYGVCVHPKYGGWFAIRGAMIFPHIKSEIPKCPPVDCVNTRELRIQLLNRFNGNWQDWTYRDVIPVIDKYSELQKKYFATIPKHRHELLKKISELQTS